MQDAFSSGFHPSIEYVGQSRQAHRTNKSVVDSVHRISDALNKRLMFTDRNSVALLPDCVDYLFKLGPTANRLIGVTLEITVIQQALSLFVRAEGRQDFPYACTVRWNNAANPAQHRQPIGCIIWPDFCNDNSAIVLDHSEMPDQIHLIYHFLNKRYRRLLKAEEIVSCIGQFKNLDPQAIHLCFWFIFNEALRFTTRKNAQNAAFRNAGSLGNLGERHSFMLLIKQLQDAQCPYHSCDRIIIAHISSCKTSFYL